MRINIYDTVFSGKGEPGIVIGKNPVNNTVEIEKNGPKFEAARRKGFINGLTLEDRTRFNSILNQVREIKEPNDKAVKLSETIDELRQDPNNYHLVRYLTSELAHLMYSENITPRYYSTDMNMVT
jgi:hypothetical protein